MEPDLILFFLLAALAIAAAFAMLLARNSVYSAIFLILNFSTIAVFYLLLFAPFIALVQIAVYAGAIMVLFLFVIMLLGADVTQEGSDLPWQKPLAIFLGLLLFAEVVFIFAIRTPAIPETPLPAVGFGSPEQIGIVLFTEYLLPFQMTGILLLVAMVGAIIITQKERMTRLKRQWGEQAAVKLMRGERPQAGSRPTDGAPEEEKEKTSQQQTAGQDRGVS
jgi:NADH-quinone oxidoreductase subunit J